MKHKTYLEVEGIQISYRFLKMVNGEWKRECKHCRKFLPVTADHFHIKGQRARRFLDRTCKECRNKANNHGGDRECNACHKVKPATTENFMVNRGALMRICKDCGNERMLVYAGRWQRKNPRQAWETKVKSCAKVRSSKSGFAYDAAAVAEIASLYRDRSLCPCCKKIMEGDDHWPSLDRINSQRGYEAGNMEFICYRCNRLKSDGTVKEFQGIIAYMNAYA